MRVGVLRRIPDTREDVDTISSRVDFLELDELFLLDNRPAVLDRMDIWAYRAHIPDVGRILQRIGLGTLAMRLEMTSALDPYLYGVKTLGRMGATPLKGARGVDTDLLPLDDDLKRYLDEGPETRSLELFRPVTVIATTNGFPTDTEGLCRLLHNYGEGLLFTGSGQKSKIIKVNYQVDRDRFGAESVILRGQNRITPFPISMDAVSRGGGAQRGYNIPYCDSRTHIISVGKRDLAVLDISGSCPQLKFYTLMQNQWT